MLVAALGLVAYNQAQESQAATSAADTLASLVQAMPEQTVLQLPLQPQPEQLPETVQDSLQETETDLPEMPVEVIGGREYIGVLRIPSLGLELPVLSQWSYPGLKIAPCRYSGSVYSADMVLCAHNYASHFGKIRELNAGEEVSFTDVDGSVYVYTVSDMETIAPTDLDAMAAGQWDLTLFTCTLGGGSRLALRCVAAESGN